MDPEPFLIFERAQELLDEMPGLTYENALGIATIQMKQQQASA